MEPEEEPEEEPSASLPEEAPATSPTERWFVILAVLLCQLRDQGEKERLAELSRAWERKFG